MKIGGLVLMLTAGSDMKGGLNMNNVNVNLNANGVNGAGNMNTNVNMNTNGVNGFISYKGGVAGVN